MELRARRSSVNKLLGKVKVAALALRWEPRTCVSVTIFGLAAA